MGVEPWDTEWAHEQAVRALEWLAQLDERREAADEAAAAGDREAYLEALRAYCRAGRDEALRIRRGTA